DHKLEEVVRMRTIAHVHARMVGARKNLLSRPGAVALLVVAQAGGILLAGGASAVAASPAPAVARGAAAVGLPVGTLCGIRCTSAATCWGVGDGGSPRALAIHWNGHGWSLVRVPSPGDDDNVLDDVACTSPGNCWAVGSALYSNFTAPNMALHWNG